MKWKIQPLQPLANLVSCGISAIFILGVMATYVQIINHLYDKAYTLAKIKGAESLAGITGIISKLVNFIRWLTIQGLLFFAVEFILLIITGVLIYNNLNGCIVKFVGLISIIIIFSSQIIHLCFTFLPSYNKFLWKNKREKEIQKILKSGK